MEYLTVYKSPFPKKRLGKINDGGYIVCDISGINYDCFLSAGIECDTSFEEDFLKEYPNLICYAFDGTINSFPSDNSNMLWIKKNIGNTNTKSTTNLHNLLEKYNNIFIKMDIEGAEIEWLESLNETHMNNISQLVIEFHNPFSEREKQIFKKINKTHSLLHFHGNNCCGTRTYEGIEVPKIFECTYINKKYIKDNLELNDEVIPSSLDSPNLVNKSEIFINHPPFVNFKNEFELESEELPLLNINNDTTIVNEIDIKYNIPKNGIRLHILGLPHTITRDEFSHCAFTGKIQRFSPMMRSVGYEVFHYGVEGSDSGADKNFNVLSLEEWNQLRFISYKIHGPNLNDEEIIKKINDPATFVGDLGNSTYPLYIEFNKRLKQLLEQNYRSRAIDIVCLPFGRGHSQAINNKNYIVVESGIGYPTSFCDFRIFESHAWLHCIYGKEDKMCVSNYNFVVPNYFDSKVWKFNSIPKKNTVGFLGRIYSGKGLHTIVEIAKRFPDIDFIICGQGDPMPFLTSANIIYKPPIHGNERSDYLGSLSALIAPTTWIEPFCGVAVEAQLCGTPVLTTDYGAQTETVEAFKTGLHCHTLADYCYGVQMALDGKFDREYIRNRAVEKYDMYNIAKKYDYCFKSILDISNGKNGWYAEKTHLPLLE